MLRSSTEARVSQMLFPVDHSLGTVLTLSGLSGGSWFILVSPKTWFCSLNLADCQQIFVDLNRKDVAESGTIFTPCYRLNSWVLQKFVFWSPNSQCDSTRIWGLWMIRVRWGHEGGALMVGLVLVKRDAREHPLPLFLSPLKHTEKRLPEHTVRR